MFVKRFVLLTAIIVLISCAEPLDTNNTEGGFQISTIKSGSILEIGKSLPVSLLYDESSENFDYLLITLLNDDGLQVAQSRIEKISFQSSRRKEISFPDTMGKGIYHIKFDIIYKDSIIFSSSVSLFHSEAEYRIKSLQTYPPDPAPDEKVFLFADFTAPAGTDPFFRWTLSGNTVYEGLLSNDGNRFVWKIPSREGVFPFSVEMFPFPPSENRIISFISSINSESVIFASESNRNKTNSLGPAGSYMTLFDFRGEIINRGFAAVRPDNLKISGSPYFDFNSGIYGYSFSNNDAAVLPYVSLPFTSLSQLADATVSFRFLPDYKSIGENSQMPEQGVFFNAAADDGSFSFQLGMRERGNYFLTVSDSLQTYTSNAFDSVSGEKDIINLSVSLYPGSSTTGIVWVINGKTVRRDEAPFRPALNEPAGSSIIGSMGRFSALIDEAGVYARNENGENSSDPHIFRNFHNEKSGRNIILAEGFETAQKSRQMTVSGNPLFRDGLAYLNPGDRLLLNRNMQVKEFSFPVQITVDGACDIIIEDETGNVLLRKSFEGFETAVFTADAKGRFNIYAVNENSAGNQDRKIIESILISRHTGSAAAENVNSSM